MSNTVRCLLRLDAVIPHQHGGVQAIYNASYDQELADEGKSFQKATPWGQINLQIDNPYAIEQLEVGAYYYFDMTKRETN